MNLFSALFTGLAVWSSPPMGPATVDTHATQVVAVAPSYQVAPLSESDVDLYLQVMRGAAGHIAQVSAEDGGAMFASASGSYDEAVADQEGLRPHYDAVKAVVEADLGPAAAGHAADAAVLAPHATEIQALQKQVNGFIYER